MYVCSCVRFVLSDETFSSTRPDAKVFDMEDVKQQGTWASTY